MSLTFAAIVVVLASFRRRLFRRRGNGADRGVEGAHDALEMAGDSRAKLVNQLIAMRGRLISAMLLGGQFVTIGASAIATSALLANFGDRGVLDATIIMTTLVVVFGEVMPKTIASLIPTACRC